jgi:hypothetical protein
LNAKRAGSIAERGGQASGNDRLLKISQAYSHTGRTASGTPSKTSVFNNHARTVS